MSPRPLLVLLFPILIVLSACAPAVVILTPDGSEGGVLPVEAQRVIDRATATAGAVATQAAFATATERSASSSATAASHATWDNLALAQTQAAMGATSNAIAAAATDAAARASATSAAAAAWATPTIAAMRTQAAIAIGQARRQQAAADSAAEFWQTLRVILLVVVASLGVVTCVLLWVAGRSLMRMAEMAQRAAIARAAFRVLSPGHWAEYEPDDGYRVYPLPGLLNAPAAVVDNIPTATDREHAWRRTFRAFCWAGEQWGFGMRTLSGLDSPYRVVSEPGWRQLRRILKNSGVLGGGNDGTYWEGGWDYRTFSDALSSGRLSLPHPDTDAPDVDLGRVSHTTTPSSATTLTTPSPA